MKQFSQFITNLHNFFTDSKKHGLQKKIVFAPGTAPMRKENSEIAEILFATDFEKAYFVDPVYGVKGKDSPLEWDISSLKTVGIDVILASKVRPGSDSGQVLRQAQDSEQSRTARMTVKFIYKGKQREITFIPGDATIPQFQPKEFTIFFSGKRIGMYPGFGLRGTPSDYLPDIVEKLPIGGYLIPDRSLLDDAVYFPVSLLELHLEEVVGVRVPIDSMPKEYSEDKRFLHAKEAPGVGLYRKIR